MTFEIGLIFLLLSGMIYFFMTEKLPIDLVAFLGLLILVVMGYVRAEEAFRGFGSATVITMLAIFIVGSALRETGVADLLAGVIHSVFGNREVPLVLAIMSTVGLFSAVMNNMAATAILMPTVGSVARRSGLAPSRLFMPLAFGGILGGTLTLVGTPPNILASEILSDNGFAPLQLFDFTPIGAILLVTGIIFMVTVGRRLLPEYRRDRSSGRDLTQIYDLQEHLFSIRVPPSSPLSGLTIKDSQIGSALDVQVVAIVRGDEKRLAPSAETIIRENDLLLVKGRLQNLQELIRIQGVEVNLIDLTDVPRPLRGETAVRLRITENAPFIGKTLREARFRELFSATVIAIKRGEQVFRENLADIVLREGDEIAAVGSREALEEMNVASGFEVLKLGLSALQELDEQLYLIKIPEGSPLVGATLESTRLGELAGVTVGGCIREGKTQLSIPPDEVLRAGDRLLVSGKPSRILNLLEIGQVEVETGTMEPGLESEEVGMVEAAIAPRSSVSNKTLRQLRFREKYGLQVLAVWREGQVYYTNLADFFLRFGDAILIQGSWDKIRILAGDPDFVVLSHTLQAPRRREKSAWAISGLLLMVVLIVTGLQPVHVAAFAGAVLVLLAGALTMEEAYRAVDWRSIFLVAALLPFATAMENTGAVSYLATRVADFTSPLGSVALLSAMVLLSSLISQALDGALAVVLLAPIAIQTAVALDISPYPLVMGVALGASMIFLTPFSGKSSLLVMGAGGYRSMDFLKVGGPLTVPLLILIILLVPQFFPF